MGFRYPDFLIAWLLMAIPVIIHLFNFRKFKKVYFSNVQLLQNVQLQTSSAKNLKEKLILLARIFAIFFLVLAFAQPYLKSGEAQSPSKSSVVSIYLDNSFSMESVNKNGTLLDDGKKKCREIISAYQLNDRFQLLTNDFEGKQQRLLSKDEILEELNQVAISLAHRNYQSIINQQQEMLLPETTSQKVAYLISDFQVQKNIKDNVAIDSAVRLNLVPLLANYLPNISVDSVYFVSPIHQPKGQEKLVYKLVNHSDEKATNVPIKLMINGVQKSFASVSLNPNETLTDTLSFTGLQAGWQNGLLSLKDYPITFDDQLYFTFEVKKELPILAIYENLAVQNIALAYQTDSFFDFQEINQTQITYSDFAKKRLIVLENLKSIAPGFAQQLKQYVVNGGNLSVFIPLNADLKSYQDFLQSVNVDYPTQLSNQSVKANAINLSHPMFLDIFDALPKNIDLPVASNYWLSSSQTRTTKQILITAEGNKNLFSVYPTQKGNIYLSFLPIESEVSNVSRHALFLPMLFKMALLGNQQNALFYTIGENDQIEISDLNIDGDDVLKIKNKEIEIIPEIRRNEQGVSLYFADQIRKSGFYSGYQQNKMFGSFAFNDDRDESNLRFYQQNQLIDLFGLAQKDIFNSQEAPIAAQIKVSKLGFPLWKLCLILTLLFLILEMLLIKFFNQRKQQITQKQ